MNGSLRALSPSKRDGLKRWELRVYVGRDPDKAVVDPATGKVIRQGPPVHVSKVFKGGKREAQQALAALSVEVGADRHIGTTATVSKLLTDWLAHLDRLDKAKSTMETYRIHVEKHLRPALGSIRLDKLTPHDVDAYLARLDTEKKLSPRTVKLNHSILSAALTQGVDWQWIAANPARRAKLRAPDSTPTAALTLDQLRTLYTAAAADDPDMAVVILLATLTDCQRGELCGLRWEDVDWDRQVVTVERQWVPSAGGQHLTTTKTKKARQVFIGNEGVVILRRYRAMQHERTGTDPDGWLLSYNGGVTPLRAKALTEYVSRLSKRCKVPAHLHTFRHWASTELNHQGVDLPTAAAQLGHTTMVMAQTYLHTSDERGAEAGRLIGAVVGKVIDLETAEYLGPGPPELLGPAMGQPLGP